MPQNFVSETERRLILLLMILITCTYFFTLEDKITKDYNENVRREQEMKVERANNPNPQTSVATFGFYDCYSPPFWFLLYGLQFFISPFCCFLLRKASVKRYAVSLFFTGFTFSLFILWAAETFNAYRLAEYYSISEIPFNELIFLYSTVYEFFLFIILGIFIVLQSFILLRFVLEKFHARIS